MSAKNNIVIALSISYIVISIHLIARRNFVETRALGQKIYLHQYKHTSIYFQVSPSVALQLLHQSDELLR